MKHGDRKSAVQGIEDSFNSINTLRDHISDTLNLFLDPVTYSKCLRYNFPGVLYEIHNVISDTIPDSLKVLFDPLLSQIPVSCKNSRKHVKEFGQNIQSHMQYIRDKLHRIRQKEIWIMYDTN